jgi:uncharacterized lipoprotein NlpE involved in copper resistance
MNIKLRTFPLIPVLALILALTFSFGLRAPAALAAPPSQDDAATDLAGMYVSESMLADDASALQVMLLLADDGTAQMMINAGEETEPSLEMGDWSLDGDALTLSLTGSFLEEYDEPVEIVFDVQEESLVASEFDETRFGADGVTLLRQSGADLFQNRMETNGALVFESDVLPAASSSGRMITLTLDEDGSAEMSTDYMNDEAPIVEVGMWETNTADSSVTVTLTGNANGDYDEPVVIVFAISEVGMLEAVEYDQDLYGEEGLTLYVAGEETEADLVEQVIDPSGVYVSDIMPAASSPGRVILMIVYVDGSLQADTYYLNNEPPIMELGTWLDNGDGTLTATITGTTERDYDTPEQLTFSYDGETLNSGALLLNRLPQAEMTVERMPLAYFASDTLPAASSPGRQIDLIFYDDNSAEMSTDYMNDEAPIVEVAQWAENVDGTVILTITGQIDREYVEPNVIVFELQGEQLVSVEWDESLYGSEGLALPQQPVEEFGAVDAESDSASDADTAVEIEVPDGAMAIFTAEGTPAASSPGINVTLVLFDDNTAAMTSDYQNDESPIIEIGEWVENEDGTVTLTLTGTVLRQYDKPVEIVFEVTDSGLLATEFDASLYGEAGLEFTTQYLAE